MRQSVLASVLDVAAANLRHTDDVRLFEIGRVYLPRPDAKLPDEPRRLALVLCGRRQPEFWGDAGQGAGRRSTSSTSRASSRRWPATCTCRRRDVPPVVGRRICTRARRRNWWRPARPIGYFGELHPKTAEAFDLAGRQVLVGEFDLEALQAATPARHGYTPVPRFPAALRDVAVIVPEATPAERVEAEIRAGGGDLLRGVRLFDLYRGDSIGPGVKSLAYALTYQADDRTLTDKEVDKAHKKIEDRLKHVLKAQIRGEE